MKDWMLGTVMYLPGSFWDLWYFSMIHVSIGNGLFVRQGKNEER